MYLSFSISGFYFSSTFKYLHTVKQSNRYLSIYKFIKFIQRNFYYMNILTRLSSWYEKFKNTSLEKTIFSTTQHYIIAYSSKAITWIFIFKVLGKYCRNIATSLSIYICYIYNLLETLYFIKILNLH